MRKQILANIKRGISALIVIVLVMTMMPQTGITVFAEEASGAVQEEVNLPTATPMEEVVPKSTPGEEKAEATATPGEENAGATVTPEGDKAEATATPEAQPEETPIADAGEKSEDAVPSKSPVREETLARTQETIIQTYEENNIFSSQAIGNLQTYADSDDDVLFGGFTGARTSMPTVGNVNTLVFVVDFADRQFSEEWKQNVEKFFFGEEDKESAYFPYESLDAYYQRASFGKLNLDGEFFYYHDTNSRDIYNDDMDSLVYTLIEEYCNSIKEQCEGTEEEKELYLNDYLKRFDSNNDGVLDGVYINYAGETTGWATQWWSYVGYYNAFKIGNYTFGSTCFADSETYKAAVTLCHETGHMLGLADYYASDGILNMIDSMDMMSDNHLDQNGFSKMLLGWIDRDKVTIIKDSGYHSLQLNPYASSGELVLIVPDYDETKGLYTEFYMVEYYEAVENDWYHRLEPYKGLRIYHVNAELNDTGFAVTNFDAIGDACAPLIQAVHPDVAEDHLEMCYDTDYFSWYGRDPYECLYTDGDELTPYTIPSSCLYNSDRRFGSIGYSGIVVDNISIKEGCATFNAGFESEKKQPELTYELTEKTAGDYSPQMTGVVQFGSDVRLTNESYTMTTGELLDSEGNKVDDLELSFLNWKFTSAYGQIKIFLADSDTVLTPQMYTIVIPAGTVRTAYGVENKEIILPYDNGKGEILQGDQSTILEYDSYFSPEWDALLDENGNGYIARIENYYDAEAGAYNYFFYWDVIEDYQVISDTKMEELDAQNTQAKYYSIGLFELGENRFGWLVWHNVINQKREFLLFTLDSQGNILSGRTIADTATENVYGILDEQFLLGGDYSDHTMYLYDFQDEKEDSSFEVSFNNLSSSGGFNKCKRLNDTSYALYLDGWVIYDESNEARIGADKSNYSIEDVIFTDEKFYVLTRESYPYKDPGNIEYGVNIYGTDYCLEKEYELSLPADSLCKVDEGFLAICSSINWRSSYGDVHCLYDDSFNIIGRIGTKISKWFLYGKKLYTLSVEDKRLIGRTYDLSSFDFSSGTSDDKNILEPPVSDVASGSKLDYFTGGNIQLSCGVEGAEIHYTLDGQTPDRYSPLYTEPIVLTKDMLNEDKQITIKAFARKEGYQDSEVATFTYTINTTISGTCEGTDIDWQFDIYSGILTISGSGDMADYLEEYDDEQGIYLVNSPWHQYSEYIKEISIGEGITSIGDYAFAHMIRVEKIPEFPNSLEKIKKSAFEDCIAVKGRMILPKNLKSIGSCAFRNWYGMEGDLEIPEGTVTIDDRAFEECSGLEGYYVTLPDSLTSIANNSFRRFNSEDELGYVNLSVSVKCYKDSYAETWAKENNFTVQYLEKEEIQAVKIPTANVASGSEVDSGTEIELSCETEGADIYYTLDETEPSKESTKYVKPFAIVEDTTIKAIAVKDGFNNSEVVTFVYTVKNLGDILPEDIPEGGVAAIPEGLWIAGVEEEGYVYTGNAIKPAVRVYDHKTLLKEKTDYTISYKNNIKAADLSASKVPAIVVTGKGNYTGIETKSFVILKKDISDDDITADDLTLKYNGRTQKPVPVVMRAGKKLSAKIDFEVIYPKLTESGTNAYKETGIYPIEITGKGNYTGTKTIYVTITDNILINKVSIGSIKPQMYTGDEIEPPLTITYKGERLTEGSDYTVEYVNNVEIGTATVVITGIGKFEGERKITFQINGYSIKKAKIEGLSASAIYTGEELQPTFKVTYAEKGIIKSLEENQNYTVSFEKNINAGTATVVLTGIHDFSGILKKTFRIKSYDIYSDVENKISVILPDTVFYEKGGSRPKPVVMFGEIQLVEGKDYTLSYKRNTALYDGSKASKEPAVIIRGKGNFVGSIEKTFYITAGDISKLSLIVPDKIHSQKQNGFKSTPVIMDTNGKKLQAGTDYLKDYVYTYAEETITEDGVTHPAGEIIDAKDVLKTGTLVNVTVTGTKSYSKSLTGQYRIVKADIAKTSVTIKPQYYTGKPVTLTKEDIIVKSGKLPVDKDEFEIVGYENNVKKGTAKVTIKGVGDTYGGTKTIKFTIKARSL